MLIFHNMHGNRTLERWPKQVVEIVVRKWYLFCYRHGTDGPGVISSVILNDSESNVIRHMFRFREDSGYRSCLTPYQKKRNDLKNEVALYHILMAWYLAIAVANALAILEPCIELSIWFFGLNDGLTRSEIWFIIIQVKRNTKALHEPMLTSPQLNPMALNLCYFIGTSEENNPWNERKYYALNFTATSSTSCNDTMIF